MDFKLRRKKNKEEQLRFRQIGEACPKQNFQLFGLRKKNDKEEQLRVRRVRFT